MECDAGMPRSRSEIAFDFAAVAGWYHQVAMLLETVGRQCDEAGVQRDPALEIVFTSVVSLVNKGAAQLDCVALRLNALEGEEAPSEVVADANSVERASGTVSAQPAGDASKVLYAAASMLADSMNRALDLVEEVGNVELVGDTHPFGHVIQGICLPYILLAADSLASKSVE